MKAAEEKFEMIIEEAIREAEHVECPLEEFCDGLRAMKDALDVRLEVSEQELRARPNGEL